MATASPELLNILVQAFLATADLLQENGVQNTHDDVFYFPERRIQTVGAVVSALLSSVLLIGSIVCLLLVSNKSVEVRVGMIVLFTCVFAGVIALLTNARRAEIFGSSAA